MVTPAPVARDDAHPSRDDLTAAPAIVMVANGAAPAALALPSSAELGRRITAAGAVHEVADERMSRDHATVRWDRGAWLIKDLDSRNGTWVNGERIAGEVKRRGDVIVRLGHTVFVLVADGRGHPAPSGDVVVGPELARAHEQIRRHAKAAAGTLLVEGEPGTGRQIAARVFHAESPRAGGPFVVAMCGGMQGVADRLLFGGKKGVVETIGHFQMARGGTLYLANIEELDPSAQAAIAKLLDVRALGTTPVDLGIVYGGQRLREAIADGKLREELFAQLEPTHVTLPPLRDRRVDLARLVQKEVAEVATQTKQAIGPHPRLLEAALLRPWPGNVTELRAAIRVASLRAIGERRDQVRPEDLAHDAGLPYGAAAAETAVERKGSGDLGKATLEAALVRANGVLAIAARALGIHRTQLIKLLDEHGIAHGE